MSRTLQRLVLIISAAMTLGAAAALNASQGGGDCTICVSGCSNPSYRCAGNANCPWPPAAMTCGQNLNCGPNQAELTCYEAWPE